MWLIVPKKLWKEAIEMGMICLTYVSFATQPMTNDDLMAILSVARAKILLHSFRDHVYF